MQPTSSRTPPTITCDGTGVVSHAGTVLLAELADRIGLTAALSEATDTLRERRAGHDPGRVLIDVAVAIADGAVTISDVQALADQQGLHGPAGSIASTPTIWRVLAGIANAPGLRAAIRQAWADARDRSLVCSQRSAPNCCQPQLWVPMVRRLSGWRLILPVLLRLVLPGGVCRTVRLG